LPWIADDIRVFDSASEQRRFFDLSRSVLERRGVRWALVRGHGPARFRNALAAIEAAV
jgi:nicotinamide riboside kinase